VLSTTNSKQGSGQRSKTAKSRHKKTLRKRDQIGRRESGERAWSTEKATPEISHTWVGMGGLARNILDHCFRRKNIEVKWELKGSSQERVNFILPSEAFVL